MKARLTDAEWARIDALVQYTETSYVGELSDLEWAAVLLHVEVVALREEAVRVAVAADVVSRVHAFTRAEGEE